MTTAHEVDTDEGFMTPVQLRRRLGISPRTYRRYVADGLLVPHHRTPKGHARYTEEALGLDRPRRGRPSIGRSAPDERESA